MLHGASGLSEEDVRECVERGMCKVNFATELRVAYTDAVKKLLDEKPETLDQKKLDNVEIEAVKETMPESITDKVARFIKDYGIPEYDANILCEDIELADYFEGVAKTSGNPKSSSNWIMTEVLKYLKDNNTEITHFPISCEDLGNIIIHIDKNVISSKIAK